MLPSSCMTARSPELKYPPRNAALVASGSRKYCGCPSSAKQGLKIIRLLYLFHCDVPSGHNLSDGFAVGGNVGEGIASVLINHTNFLRGGECVTLTSHVFGALLEREPLPEWLRIAPCKRPICLYELRTGDEFMHCMLRQRDAYFTRKIRLSDYYYYEARTKIHTLDHKHGQHVYSFSRVRQSDEP